MVFSIAVFAIVLHLNICVCHMLF